MVTELFDELKEVVIADCESELEKLASLRTFADNLCQEACLPESISDSVEPNHTHENIPTQLNLQLTPDSNIDEATLTEENPTCYDTNLAESTDLINEEESTLLELLPKSKDDDVTATTAGESCDESKSIVSDIKPVSELQLFV